jgi:5-methylcytosine-specific restriction enzyme B
MTETLDEKVLFDIFQGPFRTYRDEDWAVDWRTNYLTHLERVRDADREIWLDPTFQRMLWDEIPSPTSGLAGRSR